MAGQRELSRRGFVKPALGDAGVNVVSEGGAIQTLPLAGLKAAILGAPDNLFVQVVQ
jgi:hypothetical protein